MPAHRNSDSSIQEWPNDGHSPDFDAMGNSAAWLPVEDSLDQQIEFSPTSSLEPSAFGNDHHSPELAPRQPDLGQGGGLDYLPTEQLNAGTPAQSEVETPSADDTSWSWLPASFGGRRDNSLAFLSSLVVHLLLFILLACLVVTPELVGRDLILEADVTSGQNAELVELNDFDIAAPESSVDEVAPEVQISEPQLDIDLATDDLLKDAQAIGANPGVGSSSASAKAAQKLDVVGSGGGASFFGTYASGSEFVFVLDSSRSMKGDRWRYACDELIRSLNQLSPGQSFLVVCFDQRSKFLFNKVKYQSRSEEDITIRVRRWLRSIELGRETKPAHALKVALSLNPDAIFLLSDGELQDASVQMLRRKNSWKPEERQIPVHTVHLFSLVGKQTLEVIASENGGEFRSVN